MIGTQDLPSSADSSAAAASSTSSTGFDLINHAIRMGSGSGASIARGVVPISAPAGAPGTSISRVSSGSSTVGALGLVGGHPSDIAVAAQQHANLVRQQLGGGGIVAALQRRHRAQTATLNLSNLANVPVSLHQHLRVASYLGAASGAQAPGPVAQTPTASAATTELQDEQNARQLNPNAFQFPWKLHDMLDRSTSEGNDDVVSWVDGGEAFRVHLPDVFVEAVMPRFFKQTKYKSFQRQLNLYGFTRLHNGPNKGGYKHKYFRQGQRTMCQLITRCPIRDSSSAATAMAAAVASEDAITDRLSISNSENGARMIIDEDNTIKTVTIDASAHSAVSLASKPSSASLQQKQQQSSDAVLLSQHQAAAILAARQQALTNSFQLMEKARQEQQLQQLQVQHYEAHRLQQLQLQQQQQREVPVTSGYVPGMPLAGTDHSAYPNIASVQHSVSRSSSVNSVSETAKTKIVANSPHHLLDSSNSSSLDSVSHDPATVTHNPLNKALFEKEKLSMFHKEFQFPWKLYEMLERADEDNFSHLVSWMPGDSCFKVHDADNFVKSAMSRFFKQTKYKSFQRQLNLYGFIRVDTGPNKGGYRHPNFLKGRKDLLAMINRIKIKGNGRPRSDRSSGTAVIIDTDSSEHSNRSNVKEMKPAGVAASTSADSNSEAMSGIAVILEAIKTKEGKETTLAEAPASAAEALPSSGNVVHDVADNNSDNSTIPSTIDVQMKYSSDTKNGSGLSWRQNPSESFSDWTIEVLEEDSKAQLNGERAVYHVHRRVLAVGPKRSDYFANIFKTNGSANKTELRLTKKQAAVFPMALDYMYSDTDFDLDTEKAYTLYGLGERLENASIVQTVTEFYTKWCMTKDNAVEFLKLGQSFRNKTFLEAAVLKCSQEIWFMDAEAAAKIDHGLLLRILVISTTLARNRDVAEYDSSKLSEMVANSVTNATTLDIFRSLTDKQVLPSVEPIAAIKLLATENTILSNGSQEGKRLAGDLSLQERCISSIRKDWELVCKRLSESNELANAMRSISSIVLFDLLMQTTSQEAASTTSDLIV